MKIVELDKVSTLEIVQKLAEGGLVIMPTETTYGAMVDATNQNAVMKLGKYKNRPFGKPYSIAVTDINMAKKYVMINATAKKLYERFLPGPVTVISKANSGETTLAAGVASENGTIGVRIPDYKLVIDVIRKLGKPITATSANVSYKKRPYKIEDILLNSSERQKNLIDLIVDAGELPHREPSTVIDTTLDDVVTLRQGDIAFGTQCSVLSRAEEETKNVGKELWQKYEQFVGQRAIVFALEGEMGAGKTVFAKGVAKAIGIDDEVVSPTYTLENRYKYADIELSHIDAWRMENSDEMVAVGYEKLISDKSIIIVEWAGRVADEIRKLAEEAIVVWVKIDYTDKDEERRITWMTK